MFYCHTGPAIRCSYRLEMYQCRPNNALTSCTPQKLDLLPAHNRLTMCENRPALTHLTHVMEFPPLLLLLTLLYEEIIVIISHSHSGPAPLSITAIICIFKYISSGFDTSHSELICSPHCIMHVLF